MKGVCGCPAVDIGIQLCIDNTAAEGCSWQGSHLRDGPAERVQDALTQLLLGEPLDGSPQRLLTLLVT